MLQRTPNAIWCVRLGSPVSLRQTRWCLTVATPPSRTHCRNPNLPTAWRIGPTMHRPLQPSYEFLSDWSTHHTHSSMARVTHGTSRKPQRNHKHTESVSEITTATEGTCSRAVQDKVHTLTRRQASDTRDVLYCLVRRPRTPPRSL